MHWLKVVCLVCTAACAIGGLPKTDFDELRSLGGKDDPYDPDKWADDDDDSQIGKAIIFIPSDPDFMSKFKGVKQFVKKDLPLFHAVELKMVPDDRTQMRLYTVDGLVSEVFEIYDWDAEDIDDTLLEYGFFKKENMNDAVPAKYINGTWDEDDWEHDEL